MMKIEKSVSNISRRLKLTSGTSWIFKGNSLEKFSICNTKNHIKSNQNINNNFDKENKVMTEQKILNKLSKISSNCFLSPGEHKMGKIMGSVVDIDIENEGNDDRYESLKSDKGISQPNFMKNLKNFSNISISKNLSSNQPFQKNLINEFQNLTEEKMNTIFERSSFK